MMCGVFWKVSPPAPFVPGRHPVTPIATRGISPLHGRGRATIAAFAALVILSACTTTGGSYCAINRPLVYSDAVIDQMSDAEVERTLAELEKYRRLCRK